MARYFSIILLFLIIGCLKESNTSVQTSHDIKGRWVGTAGSLKLDFTLFTQNVGGGNVTGVCYLNDTVYINPVQGSYTYPNICLSLINPANTCNFSGKVGDGVIDGVFNYKNYINMPITLKFVQTMIS